eukprot:1160054-Pelagomonas_calceolata.AAC.1
MQSSNCLLACFLMQWTLSTTQSRSNAGCLNLWRRQVSDFMDWRVISSSLCIVATLLGGCIPALSSQNTLMFLCPQLELKRNWKKSAVHPGCIGTGPMLRLLWCLCAVLALDGRASFLLFPADVSGCQCYFGDQVVPGTLDPSGALVCYAPPPKAGLAVTSSNWRYFIPRTPDARIHACLHLLATDTATRAAVSGTARCSAAAGAMTDLMLWEPGP